MNKPAHPVSTPVGAGAGPTQEQLIQGFRTFLHTVITAGQLGCKEELAALPGPRMPDYCQVLADLPGNTLAGELACPVHAVLQQIEETIRRFRAPREGEEEADPATLAQRARLQEQLDFALALILRCLRPLAQLRAERTKCSDLLLEGVFMAVGNGVDAARLIGRYQAMHPEDGREKDGSFGSDTFPDMFAWDVYQRIDRLDQMAEEFPEHVRNAARNMHAWPMLVHRHTDNRRRFRELAQRLELGRDYPLDASEGARFRPDTPMVRYLDPLIYHLHDVRVSVEGMESPAAEAEKEMIDRYWWQWPDERTPDEVLEILRTVRRLPPLTKRTANEWAEKGVVPLVLATDARDPANCAEPVLQRIWKQKGVKSRAIFKSRLLAAVSATLRRLARTE